MNSQTVGKGILTFVLLAGSGMSFVLDWSPNHLLNPVWHPHARYHAAILLFLFAQVAAVGTWLIWRFSSEPRVACTAAALLSLAYWTPFLYVPALLPSASYWAGIPGQEPQVDGYHYYPNLIVVAIFAVLTVVGWQLGLKGHSAETRQL